MADLLKQAIEQAIVLYDRKVGEGDITTENLYLYPKHTVVNVVCQKEAKAVGNQVLKALVMHGDSTINFRPQIVNGEITNPEDIIAQLEGNGRAILTVWQVAQPILSLLENVRSTVEKTVNELKPAKIDVTHSFGLPIGYEKLFAYAVEEAGGISLGTGLDDIVFITSDHISWVGSIEKAVLNTLDEVGKLRKLIKVIVEIDTPNQVASIKGMNVNYLFCTNFSIEQVHQVGEITEGRTKLIVDQSISADDVKKLKDSGVRLYALDLRKNLITDNYFSLSFSK